MFEFITDRYYDLRRRHLVRKRIIEKFGYIPLVGDRVEDCKYNVQRIVRKDDIDTVILKDGMQCSLINCCDPVDPPPAYEVGPQVS